MHFLLSTRRRRGVSTSNLILRRRRCRAPHIFSARSRAVNNAPAQYDTHAP